LDVAERQVLINYVNDAVPWHLRVLNIKLDGTRWIWTTPDLACQVGDVANFRIRPIARNVEIPRECRPAYVFDPTSAVELAEIGQTRGGLQR
jgi:hypothetical protein